MKLTPRQREVLEHRIARAICWAQSEVYRRDAAVRIARHVVNEIDAAGSDGKAAERAVTAITERLDRSA